MGYFPELRRLVLLPHPGGSNGLALPFRGKTYTFYSRNVYVAFQAGYTLQAKGLVTLVLVML